MSEVSPGSGWWLASDGRWYPPHLAPSASAPASAHPTTAGPTTAGPTTAGPTTAGALPTVPPMAATHRGVNGLAVAAMVLGILWVYWIGSVLALVFGYVALQQLRTRDESGRGMAIAGVVLGWVGVGLGLLSLVVALIVATSGSGS